MNQLIDTYGVCNWFVDHGDSLIDQNDLARFSTLKPNGKIFQCVGVEGQFLLIRYGTEEFRVAPEVYEMVLEPKFKINQPVVVKEKEAVILDVEWHFSKEEPIYYLSFSNKRSSRRYSNQDLISRN